MSTIDEAAGGGESHLQRLPAGEGAHADEADVPDELPLPHWDRNGPVT